MSARSGRSSFDGGGGISVTIVSKISSIPRPYRALHTSANIETYIDDDSVFRIIEMFNDDVSDDEGVQHLSILRPADRIWGPGLKCLKSMRENYEKNRHSPVLQRP